MRISNSLSIAAVPIVLMAAIMGMAILGLFLTRQSNKRLEMKLTATSVAERTARCIAAGLPAVQSMTHNEQVRDALQGKGGFDNPQVRIVLEAIRASVGAQAVYVMAPDGLTIACTRFKESLLAGHNYAFRPYFQRAMKGERVIYPALGVTTGRRGLYLSAPVHRAEDEQVIGVVVVKLPLTEIDRILASLEHPAALASPEGVIFASNRPRWVFRTLAPLTREQSKAITRTRQFSGIAPTPLDDTFVADRAVLDNVTHYVERLPLGLAGWELVYCEPTLPGRPLTALQRTVLAVSLGLLLALSLIIGVLVANIRRRREAEKTLKDYRNHLEELVAARTQALNNANRHLRSEIESHQRTAHKLRSSEEKLRLCIEHAPAAIAMFDKDMRYLVVSKRWIEDYRLQGRPVIGLRHYDVLPEVPENWRREHQRCLSGAVSPRMEVSFKRLDGVTDWLRREIHPWRNDEGEIGGIIIFTQVVTELKESEARQRELEEELRQTEKMHAIGRLAGGIAHDFNNILTGILGYANILQNSHPAGGDVHKAATRIETAAQRASELTGQLLGFARKGKHQAVPVDVHKTIDEVIRRISTKLDGRTRIDRPFGDAPAIAQGDPNQIKRVLMNLATNACEAMPEGGVLAFSTERVRVDEAASEAAPRVAPGDYIRIAVSDTGTGISATDLEHVFEPFFTTKHQSRGTGMGLPMVYGIVQNHGGAVEIESLENAGTTVFVYLPASQDLAPALATEPTRSAPAAPPAMPEVSGKIMIVDDEEVVRHVAGDVLKAMGFDVASAASGEEAVAYYAERHAEVALAIIDMVMPGMSGPECLEALRRINPGLVAILSSGHCRDGIAQEMIDKGAAGFIQKPYRIGELSEAIADALCAAHPT